MNFNKKKFFTIEHFLSLIKEDIGNDGSNEIINLLQKGWSLISKNNEKEFTELPKSFQRSLKKI
jgi:hypothetical protein